MRYHFSIRQASWTTVLYVLEASRMKTSFTQRFGRKIAEAF